MPLTYVEDERPFLLERDRHLVLTCGEPLEAGLEETAERFLERTLDYWRDWVKRTRVPRDYQREVIRSALVLKLHQYEDTGALLAATTTSLPEHPGSGRTWDYRYCWLRDAYFTLNALERLGHADEMELFLVFLRNLAEERGGELQPVYTITGGDEAEERELAHLAGYRGEQPVRIGNQAFQHLQNDVYGEMILAVSRLILDARFVGSIATPQRGRARRGAARRRSTRGSRSPTPGSGSCADVQRLHSFTLLMHWAGARRAAEIGEALGAPGLSRRGAAVAEARGRAPRRALLGRRARRDHPGGGRAAARRGAAARAPPRLSPARRPARGVTCRRDPKALAVDGGLLQRYAVPDDFGLPEAAFTVCSFWLVEALASIGRRTRRGALRAPPSLDNGLGLYSEDILPERSSRAATSRRPTAMSA